MTNLRHTFSTVAPVRHFARRNGSTQLRCLSSFTRSICQTGSRNHQGTINRFNHRFLNQRNSSSTLNLSNIRSSNLSLSNSSIALGRYFSSSTLSESDVKERVMEAVRRHLSERIEDLEKSLEEVTPSSSSSSSTTPDESQRSKIQSQIDLLKQPVTEDSTWDSFGFDEFDRVEVLLEVETEFGGLTIPDDDADRIMSVRETLDYLKGVEVSSVGA